MTCSLSETLRRRAFILQLGGALSGLTQKSYRSFLVTILQDVCFVDHLEVVCMFLTEGLHEFEGAGPFATQVYQKSYVL